MVVTVTFPPKRPLRVRIDARAALDVSFISAGLIDGTVDPPIVTNPVDFTDWQVFWCDFGDMDGTKIFSAQVSVAGPTEDGKLRLFALGDLTELVQTQNLLIGRFDVFGLDEQGERHKIRDGYWRATHAVTALIAA
jgi:hypothetical protein